MPLPLVWLADILRGAGLPVVETPGWRERTSPYAGSLPWQPVGVLEHHTATPASRSNPAPTVQLCINGRSDLRGPLCHVVIGYDGTCHVIAAGRANHAGRARASGPNPAGDGNTLYVGIEWDYSGTDAPSPEQYTAAVRATRAVLDHLDLSAAHARGHRETSTTGKWDPGQVDLDQFRTDVHQEGTDVSYDDAKRALVDVLWRERHGSRVPGAEARVSLADGIMQTDAYAYQLRRQVAGLQGAVESLSTAVAAQQGIDPAELRQVITEAMANVVDVRVSVEGGTADE